MSFWLHRGLAPPNPWIVQWSTAISIAKYQGLKKPVLITTKKCYHFSSLQHTHSHTFLEKIHTKSVASRERSQLLVKGRRKICLLPFVPYKHISQEKFSVNIFSIIFTQLYQLLHFSSFFFVSFPVLILATLFNCFPR